MATSEKSTQRNYPTLTYSVPDFLVKVSLLPEEGLDLTIPEVLSSLRLPNHCRKTASISTLGERPRFAIA